MGVKVVLAIAMLAYIVRTVGGQRGAEGIGEVMARLRWEWIAVALGVHVVGTSANVVRWRALLKGQGIRPNLSFLIGSLLIARFFGAVAPGGFTGFGGWRIYDVAKHTGKVARAVATIAVETLVGMLAFGSVVMLGSAFGARFLGSSGVLLVNAAFGSIIALGVLFLARPFLFATLASLLPAKIRVRVQTLIDSLQAYRGKSSILVTAVLCAIVTHTTHFLIYVCTAQAVGATQVGVGEVFFGSALQILATMVPITPNGIGVRELTALALYESVGVSTAVAVLIPVLGFAVEMSVSMTGAFFFLARRSGYAPTIEVDDPDREKVAAAAIPEVPEHAWPQIGRGVTIGLGAGLLAGSIVGIGEGLVVVASGRTGWWVIAYGAIAYSMFCALGGAMMGAFLAWTGRLLKREAVAEPAAYARSAAMMVAVIALGLGAFRIRRDVFEEQLRWVSAQGLAVLLGCVLAAVVLYLALAATIRFVVARKPGAVMLRAWGSPAVVSALVIVLGITTVLAGGQPAEAANGRTRPPAHLPPEHQGAGNVLVVVVDTLRADHLPSYGYESGRTPNLDAFAQDAIRFDQAFANASWTRPSFASIMTGRYPSSHGVMAKSDALPEDLVTMAEAYASSGWHTTGFVTNYNVGPYFHFDQGFDEYHYLEPEFVLWADDSAAKLLLVQFLRQRIEGVRDAFFGVQPGTAYRDAETVNSHLFHWLDRAPREPWMMFVGYMDPHDPYFEHPYTGSGYGRAAHQAPSLEEADHLRRLYDGEITYWDEHFGRLVEDLRRRGLYDDMTIVITADHGEEFGDHGGFWHGTTLYDEQIRVPLFVKLPRGRRAGTVVRHWVQSVDIMPTLLAEAGIERPDGVQGGSLFEGTSRVYAEESHEGNVLESVRELRGTDELKLITANAGNPRGLPVRELFRTDLDPRETRDVSPDDASGLEHTERALQAARVQAAQGAVQGEEVELDPDSRRQLCELGYLTGEACEQ
ncbi:Choline-sulfatase [Sandaracinus amylolyticus]|uniref:Choline-sulfatase n=1 Tax=Sandaracinus amylolyticus TaxID=927083 RepID=A0A0F6YMQ8_9BACT|nr:Choline-sulfatase [Sandaracinus amylolyticus]